MDAAELAFAGLARQAELVRDGAVSARELVDLCLDRIARLDPTLNAFRVVLGDEARAQAEAVDAGRGAEGPLRGVPVAVKDDMDVAGQATMLGTSALRAPVGADSSLVAVLRAAGAIVVGKTHVPELTQWPFTESAAHGATRNPWSLAHTPGGSSGGSAAAVAAGLVGAATASDGAGSIRIPAACCGLFGLKAQRGRVSIAPRTRARGSWHDLTHYGSVARTVRDAALFLDVAGAEAPERPFVEAAAAPPGRLRIAVSTRIPPGVVARLDPARGAAVHETAALLRSLGHEVTERDPDYGPFDGLNLIARYLRGIHDVAGEFPSSALERRTRGMAGLGRALGAGSVRRAFDAEPALAVRLGALWDDHDVLLTPTLAGAPFRVGQLEGRGALGTLVPSAAQAVYLGLWNVVGRPAAAVPMGRDADGLPLSVQLVGRPRDEATLLSLSAQLETERPWADPPPAFAAS